MYNYKLTDELLKLIDQYFLFPVLSNIFNI